MVSLCIKKVQFEKSHIFHTLAVFKSSVCWLHTLDVDKMPHPCHVHACSIACWGHAQSKLQSNAGSIKCTQRKAYLWPERTMQSWQSLQWCSLDSFLKMNNVMTEITHSSNLLYTLSAVFLWISSCIAVNVQEIRRKYFHNMIHSQNSYVCWWCCDRWPHHDCAAVTITVWKYVYLCGVS